MFEGKTILITGGTGSLGTALTKRLLSTNVSKIRIFSRDEWKQTNMKSKLPDKRLRFLIGDIRDKDRLNRAMENVDIVFHAAALKHVPVAEYNPFEFVKTNVDGAQNVIDACLDAKVELAVAIGTDKAVSPSTTYGATKLLMERLFLTANFYKGKRKTRFICVRYGNVLGSRGSILPIFVENIIANKKIPITDLSMTRFNITMRQAIDLIFRAVKNGKGGEIFVPKLNAFTVKDMKNAVVELVGKKMETVQIPVRVGEKYHEVLISKHEIRNTYESKEDYIVYNFGGEELDEKRTIPFKKTKLVNEYSSDITKLFTKDELKTIIAEEKLLEEIIQHHNSDKK
jgi:UDP-N-acetylglucosamine 4,6-dehydratase/UDP-glucose 4-epimerase